MLAAASLEFNWKISGDPSSIVLNILVRQLSAERKLTLDNAEGTLVPGVVAAHEGP